MTVQTDIDTLCINTIRTLSMDGVQAANSGHPGTPMALAPVAYCLWDRFLSYDPAAPKWPNRDRFVLSVGHASMLLYSLIHLAGVKAPSGDLAVPLEDIKNFRQLDSLCPGHPESHLTAGVETTTGPLGQGAANSVGMAIASNWKAQYFNKPGYDLFGYDTYALAGDGCMMEGVTSEAASLAGHLKLSNLCWIYDNNNITIEGETDLAFSEDVATRFISYGWNVTRVADANDLDMLSRAFETFKSTTDRPTLIIVDSHIGYGSPNKQDTHDAHGAPLGDEEISLTKKNYGWPDEKFLVPGEVLEHFQSSMGAKGKEASDAWNTLFAAYEKEYPELAKQYKLMEAGELPEGWDADMPEFEVGKGVATRSSSGKVLNAFAKNIPWLMGGSADLAPSTKTNLTFDGAGELSAENPGGRNFHFGVREHAMSAILNGLSLSGIRPYGSGFLIFSDYARASIRLSALMEIPTIHVFTHDSIGVGEDGPTHQPIEQIASLRAMPGLTVIRPADAGEVISAWKALLPFTHEPAVLALSRQNLPTIDQAKYAAPQVELGAYVLAGGDETPEVIIIATGSEVAISLEAYETLTAEGIKARVVSMPSWELFEKQDQSYRDQVLPPAVKARVAVEMGSTFGWERYVGTEGEIIGMTTFGASAPLSKLLERFGFTADNIAATARKALGAVAAS